MEFKILHDVNDEIIALRTETFIKQRNVPPEVEMDGRDGQLLHFCLYEGGRLAAYLRAEALEGALHIGRVAVQTHLRQQGYGRRLMEFLLTYAAEHGFAMVELNAVHTARGFYEKLGFAAEGGYHMEAGALHIYMTKRI